MNVSLISYFIRETFARPDVGGVYDVPLRVGGRGGGGAGVAAGRGRGRGRGEGGELGRQQIMWDSPLVKK